MTSVFIGIGSNMGDRELNIRVAVDSLSPILTSIKVSQYYQTDPRDYLDQDYFLNVVVSGSTVLSPYELLKNTQKIEKNGGRIREGAIPKGPRMIDLDILLFGNEVINDKQLVIPHRAIKDRKFVLLPLLELDSSLKDSLTGKFYYKELDKIENQGVYCSSLKNYNNCF